MRPGILARWCGALALASSLNACRRPTHLSAAGQRVRIAASEPAHLAGGDYRNDALDVALDFPAGWVEKKSDDFIWMIVPKKGASSKAMIALEVPSLPPHLPGLLPMRLVKNGYLDDLKEGKKAFSSTETTPTIAGANSARLIKSIWDEDGVPMFENALIVIHANRVYIVHGEGNGGDQYLVSPSFDAVTAALHWLK